MNSSGLSMKIKEIVKMGYDLGKEIHYETIKGKNNKSRIIKILFFKEHVTVYTESGYSFVLNL